MTDTVLLPTPPRLKPPAAAVASYVLTVDVELVVDDRQDVNHRQEPHKHHTVVCTMTAGT